MEDTAPSELTREAHMLISTRTHTHLFVTVLNLSGIHLHSLVNDMLYHPESTLSVPPCIFVSIQTLREQREISGWIWLWLYVGDARPKTIQA